MTGFAVELLAAPGLPLVQRGDDLAGLIVAALARSDVTLRSRDVVVVAQKIVSKAEGRAVDLATVVPSARAVALGRETGKDPRLVEVILSESVRVVRARPKLLIVEHRLGFVMANAGIDQSNVAEPDGTQRALLLPEDPDASAAALRDRLRALTGAAVAVVINDSFGRAVAHRHRGRRDRRRRPAGAARFARAAGSVRPSARSQRRRLRRRDRGGGLAADGAGRRRHGRSWWCAASTGPRRQSPASTIVRPAQEDLFR